MAAAKTKKVMVEMVKARDTKNYVAFAVPEEKKEGAAAQNIYINKSIAGTATKAKIVIELE